MSGIHWVFNDQARRQVGALAPDWNALTAQVEAHHAATGSWCLWAREAGGLQSLNRLRSGGTRALNRIGFWVEFEGLKD
ncbi:hypothetical protein [Belnapia sp. F-4-1]|uniref:hypothetical protein n=1 Tax=Belnapia sp. F-4-1 TaxID=1545443 RepID=UPI0005B93693|nr:hypothetical protein [Belnapia sp. F-4-1]